MENTLTVIEASQNGLNSPVDTAIKSFTDWFDKYNLPYWRATSVLGLRTVLQNHGGAEADRIQLIGHGAPGLLSLGWTWTRKYSKSSAGPVYLLDSDPYSYDVLSGYPNDDDSKILKLVKPGGEVCLVGCYINDHNPFITVANGDALQSDLSQMWGCTVSAATGAVTTDELDASGIYRGEAIVWQWGPPPIRTLRPSTLPTIVPVLAPTEGVTFDRLLSAPVLGPRDRSFNAPVRIAQMLHDAFSRLVVNAQPLLAFPELIFQVTWQNRSYRANLICNQRYLEVLDAQSNVLVTLAVPPEQLREVGPVIRAWLDRLFEPSSTTPPID